MTRGLMSELETHDVVFSILLEMRDVQERGHIAKRMTWAKENLKTNFSNVLFTDECRATLAGLSN